MPRILSIAAAAALAWCAWPAAAQAQDDRLTVPVIYYTLENGLRVVLSEDHSAPKATVAVYYNIGFRIEPRDRTGFAHLFEHMMFQGSQNPGKNQFIELVQSNGGVLNGSTRFDHTNHFELGLLRQRNLHALPDDFHDSYVRRIHAVSPAEVQRIAQTYLDPQKMVVVIVGDRAAIAEQVAPFGEIR